MSGAVSKVHEILIDQIEILNPRSRNRKTHDEITASIRDIGLKRPIKVSLQSTEKGRRPYALICGQGRIEAYQALHQTHIPAIIVNAAPEQCLIESLVENIARRHHRGIDLMQEVRALKQRGLTDIEVARRIGVTPSWVNMITALLERGEETLVDAVENGVLPLSLAIEISRTDDAGAQAAMAEAYATGAIKGAKVGVLRRLVSRRSRRTVIPDNGFGRHRNARLSSEELIKLFAAETQRRQLLLKKADYAQTQVAFVTAALGELRADPDFQALLAAQGLLTLPKILADRLGQP